MTQKCGQTDQGQGVITQTELLAKHLDQQHGHKALERIQQQRHDRGRFAARAQHIGRSGVAAAVSARIMQPHDAADDDGKGQGADQISRNNGNHRIEGVQRNSSARVWH